MKESNVIYHLCLRGVDPQRSYTLVCLTSGRTISASGYQLSYVGIDIRLDNPLASEMILVKCE